MSKLSAQEAEEIALRSLINPGYFCRTFLPHWFGLPMPWAHRGIVAILTRKVDWLLEFGEEKWPRQVGAWTPEGLAKIERHFVWKEDPEDSRSPEYPLFQVERDSKGNPVKINLRVSNRTLIIAPRGFSKTTILNAVNLQDIVEHEIKFLIYLSEAATHAELQLGNVKRELEGNDLLRLVYGDKKSDRTSGRSWSQDFITTADGMHVGAKGRMGQVRGLNVDGQRPDKIVFDDVEDKESVRTIEQRQKTLDWLKGDVEPALPQIGDQITGQIIGLGTILHPEALLPTLARDPEWVVVKLGALDRDGDPLWTHYMTKTQFDAKRKSFIRLGKLDLFNMEYRSAIKVEGEDEQRKFPTSFIYKTMTREDFVGVGLALDPAISDGPDADMVAFGVTGMTERGQHHVLECICQAGMPPREQIDRFFELVWKWRPTKCGVEAIAYQRALVHLIKEEQFRRSRMMGSVAFFEIIPIKHGKIAKTPRVEGVLSPRYMAGYITHQRRFVELEDQLLDWPHGKKDGPDAVAMAISLCDPYAAFAVPDEFDEKGELIQDKLSRDEFEPLEVVLPGWRTAP